MATPDLADQLREAQGQVRELQLTRDAMQSSIDSLKVLVSNERAQARAAKRRLAAAEKSSSQSLQPDAQLAEEVQRLQQQLRETQDEMQRMGGGEEQVGEGDKGDDGEVVAALEVRCKELEESLGKEMGLRESVETECGSLREEVSRLREQTGDMDHQLAGAKQAKVEADKREAELICREEALRKQLEEKDKQITDTESELRKETAKVVSLTESVSEIPQLRSRIVELEHNLQVSDTAQELKAEELHSRAVAEQTEGLDVIAMKRKMMELKIARNVIAEKDKANHQMRERLSEAEARELEAVLAHKVSEEHAKSIDEVLTATRRELEEVMMQASKQSEQLAECEQAAIDGDEKLRKAHEDLEALNERVDEYETELKGHIAFRAVMEERLQLAEEKLAVAKENASAMEERLKGMEDDKRGHEEFRDSVQERLKIAEEQRTAAVSETEAVKDALEIAEKQVARLEGLFAKHGGLVDDLGTTSPCSTDPGAEDRGIPLLSYAESLEKMNELEEAASLAKSSYEQKCLEAQTLASSVSDNANTIVTLNRALLVSRQACDEKHEKLETFMEKANNLDRSVRKLKAELTSRIDECDFLENRIRSELEPSLLKTNSQLDQRISELKVIREEFELHKEMSEKTRIALEKEVGCLSGRLQETLSILSTTQTSLTESKQTVMDFQKEIANLRDDKRENLETIEDLRTHCEHRHQALVALESRLVSVEHTAAEHEQAALDSNREKESLSRTLEQSHDRQEVAEKRAARKDEIAEELERKVEELTRIHNAMRDGLGAKVLQLEETTSRLKELKEVVEVKSHALQNQAEVARSREALFESLTEELRSVIVSRDKDLEIAKEDLQTIERRVKSLTESLEQEKKILRNTQQDLEVSRRDHRECQSENNALDAKLYEAQEEYSRLNAQYLAALDELESKAKQIQDQFEALTDKEGKIVGLTAEKEELEKLILQVRDELAGERASREALVLQVADLEKSLANAARSISQHEEDLSVRTTEVESLSASLSNAQTNTAQLESALTQREEELDSKKRELKTLELSLSQSQQQATALESHLQDHDTLLKQCREKQEELVVANGKLEQATSYAEEVESSSEELRRRLATADAQINTLSRKLSSLEEEKEVLEGEVTIAQDARIAAENSLNCTSATLDALEISSAEEMDALKSKMKALREKVDSRESTIVATSADQSSQESAADLETKNDRLTAKVKAAESELTAVREKVASLEIKCQQMQGSLSKRDNEVERLERSLAEINQALSFARSKVEELTARNATTARGEVLTLETKLEAKEKAIANLHNWCCFINGKLHAAEKALTEREMDLEVSKEATEQLQTKLQEMEDVVSRRDTRIREVESSRIIEVSELSSRIQSLQSRVEEAIAEREKIEMALAADNGDDDAFLATKNELNKCKEAVHSKDMALFKVQARKDSLENIVKTYEQDLSTAYITIESLSLELKKVRNEDDEAVDAWGNSGVGKNLGKDQVESPSPLSGDIPSASGDVSSTRDDATARHSAYEDRAPSGDPVEAKRRTVEVMASRFAEAEKEYQERIQRLETQLVKAGGSSEATKGQNVGSECKGMGSSSSVANSNGICKVTFTLDGRCAPKAEVAVHILGEGMALGEWESARRLVIPVIGVGTNGVIRQREVSLPMNSSTTYKYAADCPTGGLDWECGEDRLLHVGGTSSLVVHDSWRSSA